MTGIINDEIDLAYKLGKRAGILKASNAFISKLSTLAMKYAGEPFAVSDLYEEMTKWIDDYDKSAGVEKL